ncbi:hypothetical protein HaLaN_09985 [Haematococcus lacustris]|uniref:Uncharacterized protein n=1 Tax=Haematococcus lacustris TaxID=44745 RepID=A0A699ZEN7_HAELA|nr:hypothetical protein HaLaN_09985 [Haematococcus lacustris]
MGHLSAWLGRESSVSGVPKLPTPGSCTAHPPPAGSTCSCLLPPPAGTRRDRGRGRGKPISDPGRASVTEAATPCVAVGPAFAAAR